ncbi:hypothetical protein [Streptomyces sp. XD-27]|uniref:hypothetical protein n=1 Tax=Streptomyces sp. XD-27 TaxID=3062779 RepID=UPI0026F41717|nr:hypothetical protein [Streptomyces sp. XD-27]WKX73287.1 hypothetical protein Q3Y56_28350 [Streptomyces sp. XD-27]
MNLRKGADMAAKNGMALGSSKAISRRREERRDALGSVLNGTWMLGQILVLFLLGVAATQHDGLGDHASSLADRSMPDHETPA